jgi:hypothetical protein
MFATARISVAAVSLIVARLQFEHTAYKTSFLEASEVKFLEMRRPE